jgi:hypothetical protein
MCLQVNHCNKVSTEAYRLLSIKYVPNFVNVQLAFASIKESKSNKINIVKMEIAKSCK